VNPLALEGTAILAADHRDALSGVLGDDAVRQAMDLVFEPGLSVMAPALLLAGTPGTHAMHDPPEGGLATGIREMMGAAGCGCLVEEDNLVILESTRRICAALDYSPLGLISSGCLLAAIAPSGAGAVVDRLHAAGHAAAIIGRVTDKAGKYEMVDARGDRGELPEFAVDELARVK